MLFSNALQNTVVLFSLQMAMGIRATPAAGEQIPFTQSGVEIFFSTNQDYVEIPAQINARDYFWAVWKRRGRDACNETPYNFNDGTGCSISFECHGDVPGITNDGMAQTLVDIVAKQAGIQEQTSTQHRICTEYCEPPRKGCCGWGFDHTWTTKIARTLEIYVKNTDTNSDQGSLRYTLSCPKPPDYACELAKLLSHALSFAAPLMGAELKAVADVFKVGGVLIKGATEISC